MCEEKLNQFTIKQDGAKQVTVVVDLEMLCSRSSILQHLDDTITAMPDVAGAESFLSTLNECHPSISFTMEVASNNKLPFLGMKITKNGCQLSTSVYRKPTNTGLLLHFHSHVDRRYKTSLLRTMVDRAYCLSSTSLNVKNLDQFFPS